MARHSLRLILIHSAFQALQQRSDCQAQTINGGGSLILAEDNTLIELLGRR